MFAVVEEPDIAWSWLSRERHFIDMELREKYNLLTFAVLRVTRTWFLAVPLRGWVGRRHPAAGYIPARCGAPSHPSRELNLIYFGSCLIL